MTSTQYTPPSAQETTARLYTTAGWISGVFLMPPKRALADYANQDHDFFKLKDVSLPGLKELIPFFALQRLSVILIVPGSADQGVESKIVKTKEQRDVSCAFDDGVVSGSLVVGSGIRMSDFMIRRQPFFPLKACTLFIRVQGKPEITRDIPMIIINRQKIIGVSEPRFV